MQGRVAPTVAAHVCTLVIMLQLLRVSLNVTLPLYDHLKQIQGVGMGVGPSLKLVCLLYSMQGFPLLEIKSVTVRYLQAYLVTVIILDITVRKSR